jgi:AcrR family transcriptional regulator
MNDIATADRTRRPRQTADERRAEVVAAGMQEFAAHGLAGASVEAIARRAGVSQPYIYQLFGTKKQLFLAVVRRGFERTQTTFAEAARRYEAGDTGQCDSVLDAMGKAYVGLLDDRTLLLVQLQAYAACSDPEVRDAVRDEFGALYRSVAAASDASPEQLHHFFADGMLLNVGAAVRRTDEPMAWSLEMFGGAD